MFSTDPGHLFDFSGKRPADIFNEAILPKVNSFADLLGEDPMGLEDARRRRETQLQQDLSREAYAEQQDDAFLNQLNERRAQQGAARPPLAVDTGFDAGGYDAPITRPPARTGGGKIKLANYGYDSDSSPDHNSNVLRIGHANNKLEDGVSAALTKSLAKRYGLKTGDYFEAVTADGKVLRRRYDDTVPTTYKGKPLPETVDLYERNGSNNFGGSVVGIRPLRSRPKEKLPSGDGDIAHYDNPILPPR